MRFHVKDPWIHTGLFLWLTLLFPLLHVAPTSASGFRIGNQSLGAVGLAGAHTAFTTGPDSNYYNPANMCFLSDQWQLESSFTLLQLPGIAYADSHVAAWSGTSEPELFFMPLLHLTSPRYGNLRYGFSLTYPYGLSKQWEQPYPRLFAEKFSLRTIEANPAVTYNPVDWLSFGGGLRVIHGKGEVHNIIDEPFSPIALRRSSEGTDTQLGYNLALSVRPSKRWALAATYRSEANLDLGGHSELQALSGSTQIAAYSGTGVVRASLPAVLSLATAYSLDRLTVELGWERTFWSSFRELGFVYDPKIVEPSLALVDSVSIKNWNDADAYRLGFTYDWNDRWTTTLGISYDRTPVPASTLGFELPDADAMVYGIGARYRYSAVTTLGLSCMYHRTRARSVSSADANSSGIDGRFTEGGAHALTLGMITNF